MNSQWTDEIIGAGLIVALILYVIGFFWVTLTTGANISAELPLAIVTGLAGYMRGASQTDTKEKPADKKPEEVNKKGNFLE